MGGEVGESEGDSPEGEAPPVGRPSALSLLRFFRAKEMKKENPYTMILFVNQTNFVKANLLRYLLIRDLSPSPFPAGEG